MRNFWPDRVFLRAYIPRAALVWAAAHVVLAVLTGGDVIVLPALAAVVLVVAVGAVGTSEARRRNEILFLQNLGVPRAVTAISWVGVAAALEVSLSIAMASFGHAR